LKHNERHVFFSGRIRVFRRRGERFAMDCINEIDNHGGGSVMIWAGISLHTKTPIVIIDGNLNARRYIDEVIQPIVIPHVQANRGMIFMQDNAPCHIARATTHMLAANRVQVLRWPSKSPDLNPIEHVWDLLDRRVRQRPVQQNLHELEMDLVQEWTALFQRSIRNYVMSMRARCLAVIAADGGHTRY